MNTFLIIEPLSAAGREGHRFLPDKRKQRKKKKQVLPEACHIRLSAAALRLLEQAEKLKRL